MRKTSGAADATGILAWKASSHPRWAGFAGISKFSPARALGFGLEQLGRRPGPELIANPVARFGQDACGPEMRR